MALTSSTPCLIRELLYAPPSPTASIGNLLEAALSFLSTSEFKRSIATYLTARDEWLQVIFEEAQAQSKTSVLSSLRGNSSTGGGGGGEGSGGGVALAVDLPIEAEIYFMLAIGLVYETQGMDDLALIQFQEAKQLAEELPAGHPDMAIPWSCVGSVYFHMEQYGHALEQYERALALRLLDLDEDHVDVALVKNNIGACLMMLNQPRKALLAFQAADGVFSTLLGPQHPRTFTASRNLVKCNHAAFADFTPTVALCPESAIKPPPPVKKKKKVVAKK